MSGDNQDAGVISVETLYIHLAQYYQQDRDSGNESDQSLNMVSQVLFSCIAPAVNCYNRYSSSCVLPATTSVFTCHWGKWHGKC